MLGRCQGAKVSMQSLSPPIRTAQQSLDQSLRRINLSMNQKKAIQKLEQKLKHYHNLAASTEDAGIKERMSAIADAYGEAIKIVEGRA